MPNLKSLGTQGDATGSTARIQHSFPAVTWPSQAAMLTGKKPDENGVVANGFFWRDTNKVEMWTAWNEKIEQPQLWDLLHDLESPKTSGVWFPMLSKGSGADCICMPAPIHKPDGSEDLWCYTKPQEFYGELLEKFGHFPLKHFWGPLANILSTKWIAETSVFAAERFRPDFWYIYLPHLDYAAQKFGPNSPEAIAALSELDQVIGELIAGMNAAYADDEVCWIAASEYVITEVDHVTYPNRILLDAGLLVTCDSDDGKIIDYEKSSAWALVDHQFSNVFVKNRDAETIAKVQQLFANVEGIEKVVVGEERNELGMNHQRSGDVVLVSNANSWQAYYFWNDDAEAPSFAPTVDIHKKPGYDPVELCFDMSTMSVPLDATLIHGSHGAICQSEAQRGIAISNEPLLHGEVVEDTQLCTIVMDYFKG